MLFVVCYSERLSPESFGGKQVGDHCLFLFLSGTSPEASVCPFLGCFGVGVYSLGVSGAGAR